MRRMYSPFAGLQYSSPANARAASSPGAPAVSSPSEPARCRSWLRSRAATSDASRRLRLTAHGFGRASRAAKSARPSASNVAGSVTRTLAACGPPSSIAISPTISPGPAVPISTTRSPGTCSDTETAPSTTNTSSRASSPCRQSTSFSRTALRRNTCASSTRSASPPPSRNGTVARKSTVPRSDIEIARLELEPVGSELGGQQRVLGYLQPGRVVGRQRLGRDDQRARPIAGRHLPAAVALRVLASDRVPEADEREVGLEHLVLGRVPAVVEREAGGDQGPAGAQTEVGRRGRVDLVRRANLAQDSQCPGGGVCELGGLRQPEGVVELRQDQTRRSTPSRWFPRCTPTAPAARARRASSACARTAAGARCARGPRACRRTGRDEGWCR